MTSKISLDQIVATLRAVAAEFPEQRDPRSDRRLPPRYVEHGKPVCLVAVVLHRLGYSVSMIRQLDREGPSSKTASTGGVHFAASRNRMLRRLDPVGRELLDEVQRQQDRGGYFTWQVVVSEALDLTDFDRRWLARNPDRVAPWKRLTATNPPTEGETS